MLNFSKNQLEISSEDVEKGSADEILEIGAESTKVENFQIGFNYKYLLQFTARLPAIRLVLISYFLKISNF